MFTILRIAWRNLGRNRKRTALALGAIILAQFCVLVIDGFMSGYGDSMRNLMTGPMLGHFQVHAEEYRDKRSMDLVIERADDRLKALRERPEVQNAMPRLFGPALVAKTQEGFMGIVIGVDPEAEHAVGGLMGDDVMSIVDGKGELGLPRDDKKRLTALVGAALARRQGLKLGDELAIIGQSAEGSTAAELVVVGGIIKSNLEIVSNQGILISLKDAQEAFVMEDQVHEITVRGESPDQAAALASAVAAGPEFKNLEVIPWRELAPELVDMIGMMDYSTLFMLVLVFLAAAAGVANTMLMSTFERTHEMGMLLALGTRPGQIVMMILFETAILGVLGIAVGSVLGSAWNIVLGIDGFDMAVLTGEQIDQLTFQGMNFDFRIYPRVRSEAIIWGTCAMSVTSLLACLWPASFIARLQPTEAMRG